MVSGVVSLWKRGIQSSRNDVEQDAHREWFDLAMQAHAVGSKALILPPRLLTSVIARPVSL